MSESLERAIDRHPRSWYAHLELGIALAELGRRSVALRELATASQLNPRDEIVRSVLRDVRAGHRIKRDQIDRRILDRSRARIHG
jgi:hypothetical protein